MCLRVRFTTGSRRIRITGCLNSSETILSKMFWLWSSHLTSTTTSSDTESLPDFLPHLMKGEDFPLLRLPVRTNLLITLPPLTMFLEFTNQDIGQIFLLTSAYYPLSVYKYPIAIIRHNNESVLFNTINYFHGLHFLAKNRLFRCSVSSIIAYRLENPKYFFITIFWVWNLLHSGYKCMLVSNNYIVVRKQHCNK